MNTEKNADALIADVVRREGGFVNDPSDRGGATKYGITIGTLSSWRGRPVSVSEVQNLTLDEAVAIYKKRYVEDPGMGDIKDPKIQAIMVDFGVLSGPRRAVQGLQKALGVPADGIFGPMSRAALAAHSNPAELFYKLKVERLDQFLRIIGGNASQQRFATGWANRLTEFEY